MVSLGDMGDYTFKTAAPGDYDASATHTVGGYATRAGRSSVSNDVFDFVPNGGAVQERREAVTIDACNACHDNLAAHGGTRRDTKLCVLCHTSQTKDPESGNTVDFKVLVHKIHEGANLPSVEAGSPYVILGFNLSRFDASDIRWPQDTRNCQTCHKGPQSDFFKTKPSAEACGSCHDNVNFTTGQNHAGGPQPNSACSTCHAPDGGEFDLSVTGAHTIPEKSKQLRGVNFEILSFTNTAPGQSPTVVFSIKDNAGNAIQPSEMASLALILAGPTTDYSTAVNETVTAANSTVGADGNVSYTFKVKIPDDAVGSWGVATQGYLTKQLKNFLGATVTSEGNPDIRDVGFNKVAYAAVTDPVAMPRKQVVDVGLCNKCHETLALHGGSRRNTEFCVFCHNPNGTDVAKRTTAGGPMPPESIVFSRLIHRVHTGEEQQDKPYIIYGGSPASPGPVNLSEARFPTDRKNCAKCHVPQSNLLPFIRPNMLPTTVKVGDDIAFQMGPIQTACMGCHDSQAARAHGDTMTASGNREACLVCHNEGRDQAVSQVHRYP